MATAIRRNAWVVTAAVLSLVVTVQQFRDSDVWWHLAMGRYIVAHGIPAQEPFSFLHAANPWIGQQWLYEVTLARLVAFGGPGLASLLMGMVASGALLVAMLSLRRDRRPGGPWMAAALLLCTLIAAELLGVRGQVISLFGAAVVLYVVSRWRSGSHGWPYLLPPLFALWANLHAGFIIGLGIGVVALVFVDGVDRRARVRLGTFLALAAAATLLNPAGPSLWGYVAATFTNPTLTGAVTEWQSPDFHSTWLRLFELGAILLVTAWFLAPRRDRFDLVLAGLVFAASLQAQRNVSLFALVAAPQLAHYGADAWAAHGHRLRRRPDRRVTTGVRRRWAAPPSWFAPLGAVIVVVATAVAVVPQLSRSTTVGFEAAHEPLAAADYVATHLAGQRLYSPDTWAGYLAERFPTGRVVYLYDETAIFGQAALQRYLDVHNLSAGWPQLFTTGGVGTAVLPADGQEVSALLSIGWRVDCRDPASQSVVMSAGAGTASTSASQVTSAPACA